MNGALALRYAAALADVALEQKNGDQIRRDLASFADAFESSADLRNFLESPPISREVKHSVIGKIAQQMNLVPAVRNFVFLLLDHRRTEMLREIQQTFDTELNARMGIAEAEVISARGLSDAQKRELTAALERRTGKKIEAKFHEDEALLGGAIVRVGSTVYDGSVREQLSRLREQLETE